MDEHREPVATVIVLSPRPIEGLTQRSVRAGLGVVGLVVQGVDRATGGSGRVPASVDVAVGAAAAVSDTAAAVGGALASVAGLVAGPVVGRLMRPAPLPRRWWPQTTVDGWRERGRALRRDEADALDAVVRRVGEPAVGWVLARVDVGSLVVRHVDLEQVVTAALDELDLTQVVLSRVDLERVVTGALDELDLTQVVLSRVDLQRVVTAVLDQLDLTALVEQRVDIDALAATIDLDAIIDRIDLVGLADYIVDEIDLPAIIQQSTGSVASEAVRGVRMQSIDADRKASTVVDRLLLRRRERRTDAPGEPQSLARTDEDAHT